MKTILLRLAALMAVSGGLLSSSAARADTFTTDEFVTYTQADWGNGGNPTANTLLRDNFVNVYAATAGTLTVGAGISMYFDSASALIAYMPTSGNVATLDAAVSDPGTTSSGAFGGDVLGLVLDVDFSNYGALHGTSSTPFGNLILVNFNPNSVDFDLNGMSVTQFLAISETALGGGSTDGHTLDDIDTIVAELGSSFDAGNPGTVSEFATDHLEAPPSETPAPAALPLFASGLGAMGLFGWRKKRKNAASSIAAA